MRTVSAVAAFAAVAASLSGADASLTVNAVTSSAYTYQNEPFQCAQPSTNVNVNATHAWIVVTSYSQTSTDVQTALAPAGRSQFAWATFLSNIAYPASSWWDPSQSSGTNGNPTLANVFSGPNAQSTFVPSGDQYLFSGSCGLGGNKATSNVNAQYTSVSTLTKTPTGIPAGAQSTTTLAPYTWQSAGCNCPSYGLSVDGFSVVDFSLNGQTPTGTNQYFCGYANESAPVTGSGTRVFYTHAGNSFNGRAASINSQQKGVTQSSNTNYWNIRQTTCGQTSGDVCESAGSLPTTAFVAGRGAGAPLAQISHHTPGSLIRIRHALAGAPAGGPRGGHLPYRFPVLLREQQRGGHVQHVLSQD